MAKRSILHTADEEPAINLSPMIDCIFILLIFFIVTTVFVEESGIQVNKPDASEIPLEADESDQLNINITANNRVLHNEKEIGVKGIAQIIRRHLKNSDTPVSIQAHEKADHGLFVAVWDAVQFAGAKRISFSTEN